jgi:hypothetical protein
LKDLFGEFADFLKKVPKNKVEKRLFGQGEALPASKNF